MVVVLWQLSGRSDGHDCRAAKVPVVNASGSSDLYIFLIFSFGVSMLGFGRVEGTFYIGLADKIPSYTSLR